MYKIKRYFLIFSFSYVYLLLTLIVPTEISVILPGDTQNTQDIFSIEGYKVHNMQTIYVLNYAPLSYFQSSLLSLDSHHSTYDITAYEKSLTPLQMFEVGQIQKTSSYQTALLVALEKAGLSYQYIFRGYALTSIPNANSALKIGDIIFDINGIGLTPFTSLTSFYQEKKLTLTILRDDNVISIEYQREIDDIPLYLYPLYWITETEVNIDLVGLNNVVGGPSSGLMMTLSIYATLLNIESIYKLAGTGTIHISGDIGSIGGLYQKYITVIDEVDYMLIPYQQRLTLSHVNQEKLVYVNTIDDAIAFLRGIYELDQ
jgi:PDZ domain-containing protein